MINNMKKDRLYDKWNNRYISEHRDIKPNTPVQIKLKGKLINAKSVSTSIDGKLNVTANGKKYFCQLDMNTWKVMNQI